MCSVLAQQVMEHLEPEGEAVAEGVQNEAVAEGTLTRSRGRKAQDGSSTD